MKTAVEEWNRVDGNHKITLNTLKKFVKCDPDCQVLCGTEKTKSQTKPGLIRFWYDIIKDQHVQGNRGTGTKAKAEKMQREREREQ